MGPNIQHLEPKHAQALALKAEGKSFEEIAMIQGCSRSTAFRRFCKAKEQDGTFKDIIEELKFSCLEIAIEAKQVTSRYLKETKTDPKVHSESAKIANMAAENNLKGYSSLAGAKTDDKGGEVADDTKEAMNALLDRLL